MEEMAALEQRATKELELRDRDISASQARVEEARGAATAAREALAEKRRALKVRPAVCPRGRGTRAMCATLWNQPSRALFQDFHGCSIA